MTELTEAERREMTNALIAADDDAYVRGQESATADKAITAVATVVERIITARLAPIRRTHENLATLRDNAVLPDVQQAYRSAAHMVRNALSAHESAPQPHDGTRSHPDDERAGERRVDPTTLDGIYDDLTTIRNQTDALLAKIASHAGSPT